MKKKNDASMEFKLKIGENIRKWRNLKGIKQKELALLLDVSEAAISNIENNITDLTLRQLERISAGLDVPFEKLFTDPRDTMELNTAGNDKHAVQYLPLMDKELLNTIMTSLQKKDEQLQTILQQVIASMNIFMGQPYIQQRQAGAGKRPYELNE